MAKLHLAASVSGSWYVGSVSHCYGLLGHLNRTEPLLIILVTPFPSITSQNVCCRKGRLFFIDFISTSRCSLYPLCPFSDCSAPCKNTKWTSLIASAFLLLPVPLFLLVFGILNIPFNQFLLGGVCRWLQGSDWLTGWIIHSVQMRSPWP